MIPMLRRVTFEHLDDRLSILQAELIAGQVMGMAISLDGGSIKAEEGIHQSAFLSLPWGPFFLRQCGGSQQATQCNTCLDMPKQSTTMRVTT
jgi:hypothetical protein